MTEIPPQDLEDRKQRARAEYKYYKAQRERTIAEYSKWNELYWQARAELQRLGIDPDNALILEN